jgi:predicted DNA-binding transcriptional regulator AlpA
MALILKKKESGYRSWYEKNKQRLSERRKKLYVENPEYRQRVLETSRKRRRGEPTLPSPHDARIPFAQAAERTGISISTLHAWRRKKYFPEPKHHSRRLRFSEKQVLLLNNLKEFFTLYGKRRWNMKKNQLKEVVASICSHWE